MRRSDRVNASRLRPLAACLALACSANIFASPEALTSAFAAVNDTAPRQPTVTLTVKNCDDHGPDSLRDAIATASEGAFIEFDLNQMGCSTITLTTGQILINQNTLTIRGPEGNGGSITVSGNNANRVLKHVGTGTLTIEALTISDGSDHPANGEAIGGCIQGSGSIYLRRAVVVGCEATSDTGGARGEAIDVEQDATMVLSTISGNRAESVSFPNHGGGISANNLFANYSSISANVAGAQGTGGGVYAITNVSIIGSTIDHNSAMWASGLRFKNATILNSTISENTAYTRNAIYAAQSYSLSISNSTIAFNHSESDTGVGAAVLMVGLTPTSAFKLESSIVANNTEGVGNTPSDISVYPGHGALSGAHNLVIASNVSPPGVISVSADPQLGALQFNGGWTFTHALLPNSPAREGGDTLAMPPWLLSDQRGPGYPRATGPNNTTDIGAFEFDSIFSGHFDFN